LAAAASGHRGARRLTHARQQGLPRQEPEDGLIWVLSLGDESVMAFTDDGVDSLVELIKIHGETTPR
jgi:hypothetical protein